MFLVQVPYTAQGCFLVRKQSSVLLTFRTYCLTNKSYFRVCPFAVELALDLYYSLLSLGREFWFMLSSSWR
jgi:hypothetical protein